ncbi:MAG: hypothetical protein LUH40_06720 [Clostridiales bacterium]|nr:hypothetical protein [Clostridiales bacterium]
MTDKFWGIMGICRRAGKLFIGHDDVKAALRGKKVSLVIFTSDASERLKEEITNLSGNIRCIQTDCGRDEALFRIGKGAAVFAVGDEGLAKSALAAAQD